MVLVAATDDSKAGVLCDFFSSVFCTENDSLFHVLSNKNCDVASEAPSFNMNDIINRLKKIKINKSLGPDMIHPRILYETADQIAYPLKCCLKALFVINVCHQNGSTQILHPYTKKVHDRTPGTTDQ